MQFRCIIVAVSLRDGCAVNWPLDRKLTLWPQRACGAGRVQRRALDLDRAFRASAWLGQFLCRFASLANSARPASFERVSLARRLSSFGLIAAILITFADVFFGCAAIDDDDVWSLLGALKNAP